MRNPFSSRILLQVFDYCCLISKTPNGKWFKISKLSRPSFYHALYYNQCHCRSRLSSGYRTLHWIRGSRFQTRPGSSDFSERQNPEYDFLRKGSKSRWSLVIDLRHVKEPQAEIRASEQNLSDFSRSKYKATIMI